MQVTSLEATMLHTLISPSPRAAAIPGAAVLTAVVLILWFALVVWLGGAGAYVAPPGAPPIAIAAGFSAPLAVFFAGLAISPAFRRFVRSLDVRVMTTMQAWRFAGLGFLALYAYGVLPGGFALPAGLGDIAIALAALAMLAQEPGFAASKTFVTWNLLGILDLVVAVGSGTLISLVAATGEITTRPVSELPLVIIPAYFVPLFIMMYVSSLMQARRATGERR